MVDISGKALTRRTAVARARVRAPTEVWQALASSESKSAISSTASIAGILAAKRTAELIPMCHQLQLAHCDVKVRSSVSFKSRRPAATLTAQINFDHAPSIEVECSARTDHGTGVEMEALTGASVAALTVYDMCKGASKAMVIENVALVMKTGGKSGDWKAAVADENSRI